MPAWRCAWVQCAGPVERGPVRHCARLQGAERLQPTPSGLPPGRDPKMGPPTPGLGEFTMYTMDAKDGATNADGSPVTATDLRLVQDWIVHPQLLRVPGVADINYIGGYDKQFLIRPDPAKPLAYGVWLEIGGAVGRERRCV